MLLPIGVAPREDARRALALDTPSIALPIPVEVRPQAGAARDRIAVSYAGNPEKKGLDLLVGAWARVTPARWRLVVTGIEPERARRFLERRALREPPGIEWAGFLDEGAYAALVSRARVFLAASRYEDYGIAQLEALAAGTPLVTVPSDGPYEALRLARELAPGLVAARVSDDALAGALEAGFALGDAERAAYASRAAELLHPYSRAELRRRLRDDVLPVLLR